MQPSRNCLVDIKERLSYLENTLSDPFSELNIERVLDVFISSVLDSQRFPKDKQDSQILAFSERFKDSVEFLLGLRRQRHDFTFIASLGRGAYGNVDLVRENATGRICAMKTLNKSKMLSQQADFWAEREIMARSVSPWIVRLFYSFQDVRSLYMVMEYVPGGTLVCWMDEVELISETVCRFYAAEITQALSDLHDMGFIHRDIKPDNMLLDISGHLKLADFGTCVRVDPATLRVRCESAVGTPDYISPEVLYSQSSGGGEYGFGVDWWSLGILVYEMLCGETPFYSDDLVTTYSKIMSHTTSLHLPKDIAITPSCLDFIKRLLSPESVRLGSGPGGADEVRSHAWFSPTWATHECLPARVNEPGDEAFFDWTWRSLRSINPGPFQPTLTSETDTSYFREEQEHSHQHQHEEQDQQATDQAEENHDGELTVDGVERNGELTFEGSQMSFAGFTFSSPRLAPLSGIYFSPAQEEDEKRIAADEDLEGGQAKRIHELEEALAQAKLQLVTAELRFTESLSDAERRFEVLKLEHASVVHQMEAEVAKLKVMVETERQARQSAETQKAKAVDLLAKRATDMADRLTGSCGLAVGTVATTSTSGASAQRRQASLPVEMPSRLLAGEWSENEASSSTSTAADSALPGEQENTEGEDDGERGNADSSSTQSGLGAAPDTTTTSAATELLLKRIQELVDRAKQAEEQLEIERRFAELYKKACEEKEDQLAERDQRIATLSEALEAAKQSKEQAQLATRHALMEEQERSAQYLECLKAAEKASEVANRRSQIAATEVIELREVLNTLREDLAKSNEELASEKLKCSAAVNKIQQILSGENADALELMMLSEMEATRNAASAPSNAAGGVVARATKKFTSQQHLLRQLDRKYKRLISDYEQMQAKHRAEMKEARTMFHASQESAQSARNQVTHLTEEVAALQTQLTAANTALKALAAATAAAGDTPGPAGLHRIPAPLSTAHGGSRTLRSRLARKTTSDADHHASHQKAVEGNGSKSMDASSSSEVDRVPPLETARSPTRLQRVSSLSSPARQTLAPLTPLPVNFCFSGRLDLPGKPGRRKKLVWDQRFAKLTFSRLLVWDTPAQIPVSGPIDTQTSGVGGGVGGDAGGGGGVGVGGISITGGRKLSRPGPNLLLDLPLNAILHVRSVTSCDVLHAPPEDLPKIFQIIYDQCEAGAIRTLALDTRISSPDSSPHCSTPPPKSSHGTSKTLPRKLSFSSSSSFGVGGRGVQLQQHHLAKPSRTSSSSQLSALSHAVSSDPLVMPSAPNAPIALHGHLLQRIHFRVPAVCELCRKACWHVISPPPALQCLHCQLKMHLSHVEKRDQVLRPCGKSTAIKLFRAPSEEAKKAWLKNLQWAVSSTTKTTSLSASPPGSQSSSLSLCSASMGRDDRPRSLGMSTMRVGRGSVIMRSATLPYSTRTSVSASEKTPQEGQGSKDFEPAPIVKGAREAELDEEDVFLDSPEVKSQREPEHHGTVDL